MLGEELEKAAQVYKKAETADVRGKLFNGQQNEAFLSIISDQEALKTFIKQCGQMLQSSKHTASSMMQDTADSFKLIAESITVGNTYLGKELEKTVTEIIRSNTELYRNIFAEINGYDTLRNFTDAEKDRVNFFMKQFQAIRKQKQKADMKFKMKCF